jgi:hypothetical protein
MNFLRTVNSKFLPSRLVFIIDLKLFALTTNVRLSRYMTAKNANRADARAWPPGT